MFVDWTKISTKIAYVKKRILHQDNNKLRGQSNRKRYRPFYQRGEGSHPGAGKITLTWHWSKVVSVWSLERLCDERDTQSRDNQEKNLDLTKGKKTVEMLHRKCRTICVGNKATNYSIFGHNSKRALASNRHLVPEIEVDETMLNFLEPFSEDIKHDDEALVRNSLSAGGGAGNTLLQHRNLPRLELRWVETLPPKRKRKLEKEVQRFRT